MKYNIVEQIIYVLLIIMFSTIVISLPILYKEAQKIKTEHVQIEQQVRQIQESLNR